MCQQSLIGLVLLPKSESMAGPDSIGVIEASAPGPGMNLGAVAKFYHQR